MHSLFGLWPSVLLAGCLPAALIAAEPATPNEVSLGRGIVVQLASAEEGRQVLAMRDAFIDELSPFDRQARLRSDREVSADEVLRHAAEQARDWNEDETQRIVAALTPLAARLARWELPLPKTVLVVKTTGEEEGNAAYCRGAAIVLPRRMIAQTPDRLERLLAHELFHVLNSHNPKLRDRLYAIIGFEPSGSIELPDSLARRKITNPDAPRVEHVLALEHEGEPLIVAPLLVADRDRYDPARGGTLFTYLQFRLLAVERRDDRFAARLDATGEPMLLKAEDVPDYRRRIGENTNYIIHPEEILADNFALLVTGKTDVPTPRILDEMDRVLKQGDAP
jgi:hypothetical protein